MPSHGQSMWMSALLACVAAPPVFGDTPTPGTLQSPELRGRVEILRDDFGVAHVFAEREFDLFFGYGYAAAEDRMFQMDLVRRSVAGRLAEVLGDRPLSAADTERRRPGRGNRREQTTLDHDRVVRVWGLYDHAQRVYPTLSEATRTACEGYAAGVNFYLAEHPDKLLYLFESLGYRPERWTPVDAAACWYQIVIKLGGSWLNAARRPPRPANAARRPAPSRYTAEFDDESDCHVSEEEMRRDRETYEELMRIKESRSNRERDNRRSSVQHLDAFLASLDMDALDTPRMSHAWAVGAMRSATGHAILESDPQLPVTCPSPLYEIHLHGGRYNVRGVSIPGAPGFLIGRSEHLAWGATAAGGHHFNLYAETFAGDDANRYQHQGETRTIRIRDETIHVKGGPAVTLKVRHTVHGPIVSDHLVPGPANRRDVALAHVATTAATLSVQGLLALGRARDWNGFRDALVDLHVPAAHFIVADRAGRVGYQLAASVPYISEGLSNDVLDGASGRFDWQPFSDDVRTGPFLPIRLLPNVFDPPRGDIASGNNTSVGSWYPLDLGFRGRDTDRSMRLREMLAARPKHSVDDFQTMHADMESPKPRTFIRMALAMLQDNPPDSDALRNAQRILSKWNGRMELDAPTWPLVSEIARRLHRYVNMRDWPELARRYGPGPIAAANLAKRFTESLRMNETLDDPQVRRAVLELVEASARDVLAEYGTDESEWKLPPNTDQHAMPFQAGLLGFGSFDRRRDQSVSFPCVEIETIRSPRGNCYTILAEMGDLDHNWTILSPGISEHPSSPHFADQIDDWRHARLHRAYMTREAVKRVATAHTVLEP